MMVPFDAHETLHLAVKLVASDQRYNLNIVDVVVCVQVAFKFYVSCKIPSDSSRSEQFNGQVGLGGGAIECALCVLLLFLNGHLWNAHLYVT